MRTLLFAVMLLAQTRPAAPVQTGTIAGRLLSANGAPAVGVRVSATPAVEPAKAGAAPANPVNDVPVLMTLAQTDASGRYLLENVPAGRYYILAGFLDTPTYYPGVTTTAAATAVSVTARAAVTGIDFQAARSSTGLTLKGRLKRDSNQPVSGMNVSLGGSDQYLSARSMGDGSFEFPKLRPGTYSISASSPGAVPQSVVLADKDITDFELVVPWTVDVTASLAVEGGALRPMVSLVFAGESRNNNSLQVRDSSRMTLPEGPYGVAVNGIPSGYYLKSLKSGSTDLLVEPLKLSRDTTPAPIVLSLGVSSPAPWVKLSGNVTGSAGVTGASISLSGQVIDTLEAAIGPDGSFEFPRILPGTYSATVRPTPISLPSTTIVVPASGLSGVQLSIPAVKEVVIRVTVEDGGPIPNLYMSLNGTLGSPAINAGASTLAQLLSGTQQGRESFMSVNPRSQPDGTFKVSLPEGKYRITPPSQNQALNGTSAYSLKSFTYGETDLLKAPATVTTSDSSELRLVFAPNSPVTWSRVTGRVTGVDSALLTATPVTVTLSGNGFQSSLSAAVKPDGAFEFPRVYPGNYAARVVPSVNNIMVSASGLIFAALTATLNVAGADITGFDLAVPHQKEVTGRVILEGRGVMPRFLLPTAPVSSGSNVQVVNSPAININPQADGTFKATVLEGERHVNAAAGLPSGYAVKSLMYGTSDLLKSPLKVLTSDTSELVVTLTAPNVAPVRVSGRITALDGSPFTQSPARVNMYGTSYNTQLEVPVKSDGTFEFADVFAGDYSVRVSVSGVSNSPTIPVVVANTDVRNIEIAIPRSKDVTGRVILEGRGAMPRFSVPTMPMLPERGVQVLSQTSININPQADGTFRSTLLEGERRVGNISGLPPGYAVKSLTYGTTDLLKNPLKVLTSDTSELVVTLTAPNVAPVRVSGRVTGLDGASPTQNSMRAIMTGNSATTTIDTPVKADGTFEFAEVFAGKYSVHLLAPRLANLPTVSVVVANADVRNVELAVPRQKEITGRVILEGRGAMPRLQIPFQQVAATPGNTAAANASGIGPTAMIGVSPQADGTFMIPLLEGERRVGNINGLPPGYAVKSLTYGTTDLLKNPLKVSMSDTSEFVVTLTTPNVGPVHLSGKVTGLDNASPTRGLRVILAGSAAARPMDVPIQPDGTFEFTDVFAGTYTARVSGPGLLNTPLSNITVANADVRDIEIVVPHQKEITGHVFLEGSAPMPRFQISLLSVSNGPVPSAQSAFFGINPQPNGSFTLVLPEGERKISVTGLPAGYTLKSLTYGTTDVLTNPLKVVLSDTSELHVTLTASNITSVHVSGKVTGLEGVLSARNATRATLTNTASTATVDVPVKPDGTFEFSNVYAGNYRVSLLAPGVGILPMVPVVVANTDVRNIEVAVTRQKEISGRVILEGSGPMPRFQLLFPQSINAARSAVIVSALGALPASILGTSPQPDGTFKIALAEGEHAAGKIVGLPSGYVVKSLTYGAADVLNNPLKVKNADTYELRLTLKVPALTAVRVRGKFTGLDAGIFNRGPVTANLSGQSYAEPLRVSVKADGSFDFPEVFPDTYTLAASGTGFANPGPMSITVGNADIRDIEAVIPPQREASGRVVVEGGGPPPQFTLQMRTSSRSMTASVRPDADGSFRIVLMEGERTAIFGSLPDGYTLKSATYGKTDILKNPLVVSRTDTSELVVTLTSTGR